ncbi:hypothetical protein Bhyg_08393 [Pseudolycoriella hygida]|uniref:Uncharacterized protein n=1 Tax=Pseudolycoriella hygida TaxID=35572 RepID=A0A9Q0N4K4_9DIPT|nr:hypothetical protein Bhyg_08393 [Pseudolycoriella hygida]
MVSIPIVNSFCGCLDLKVACVIIAGIILVINIGESIYYIVALCIVDEVVRKEVDKDETFKISVIKFLVYAFFLVKLIVSIITVVASYWFIRGVTTGQVHKMKLYVIILAIDVVIYILMGIEISLFIWIVALVEFYLFICSYSLYKQLTSPFEGGAASTTETAGMKKGFNPPPPPYDSCENDMKSPSGPSGPSDASYSKQYP